MFTLIPGLNVLQAAAPSGDLVQMIITFGLIFVIFYFLIIRPQNKKQKETQKMLAAVKKGDKVVSIGGIHGIVHAVKEATVVVKVDDDTKLEFSKSALASVVPQGSAVEVPAPEAKEEKK